MEEKTENEPPILRIDPKCIQDALRAFLLPIKSDDARLDFYTVYKKEATEYDTYYVKKYDEDLNITLIFAGLFSAVSSAFVLDVQSKLEPDPNEQSAALLRAILLTLNQSAIPGEILTVPPIREDTPSEITVASCLMYASLLVSLLAAFIAMLGKQWLNRYLRNTGGSTIERCGDRQRKLEGLERWPFHTFVESLPVMLQIALLLLACGLCRQMASVNTSVAGVLTVFTTLGVLFYLGIVVAGASSYECPFQAPPSAALQNLWKKTRPRITPVVLPIIFSLHSLWEVILCQILRTALRLPLKLELLHRFRHPHHPNMGEGLPTPQFMAINTLWEKIQSGILHTALRLPVPFRHRFCCPPLPTVQDGPLVPQEPTPWLTQKDLAAFLRRNESDTRCVSWILRNITDPEAVDAAIRLAGTVRWFDDQTDVEPPHDAIVSVFEACFDSDKNVYPGLKDRAYYSLRAILWIHVLAKYASHAFAQRFPLPIIRKMPSDEDDLAHLLIVCFLPTGPRNHHIFRPLYTIPRGTAPGHAQWTSNLLLHLALAGQGDLSFPHRFRRFQSQTEYQYDDWDIIPLDATLNRFLVWCIFLGSSVEEEALRIQDKSDRLEYILSKLHQAIITAIVDPTKPHHNESLLPDILHSLTMWKSRPKLFTMMSCDWCSAIFKRYPDPEAECGTGRTLLFLSLEIGFRHLDLQDVDPGYRFTITDADHHQKMVKVVFEDGSDEVVADFIHAWTPRWWCYGTRHSLHQRCISHLADLRRLQPFSPRLRYRLVYFISLLGRRGFEQLEGEKGERFFELLDHLHVRVEDMSCPNLWVEFLLGVIQSTGGIRRLPYPYWEQLVELAIAIPWRPKMPDERYKQYAHIMESLEDAEEWDRLECWIGFAWGFWGTNPFWGADNLESGTLSLFRQRPDSVQKLERWMERIGWWRVESFRSLCPQRVLDVAGQHPPEETGEHVRSLPPAVPLSFVADDTF